jgi:hypothetical protein
MPQLRIGIFFYDPLNTMVLARAFGYKLLCISLSL